ncbi:hypothetical protein V5O48_001221 [Marasmius crinis-equi]|uniref:Mitochondrial zinc maintenance protein 1, mitochondrial n=1 Tax=Marasmius crinis-equi TaxID=585013 RepID=A0ABR3FYZ5_9AGAR
MNHVMNTPSSPYSVGPESLAFRNNLAKLISPLKRVRPTVPFWRLAAHRIPTLHLYRSLLKESPTHHIQWRVKRLFRRNQHLTGPGDTTRELTKGYKWLDIFRAANASDTHYQAVLERYDRMIRAKIDKEHLRDLIDKEMAWQHRLKNRPILTGAIVPGTPFHPPFPRMKPQPMEISRIILKRIKAKQKNIEKVHTMNQYKDMARLEREFEQGLLGKEPEKMIWGGDAYRDWITPLAETTREIHAKGRARVERFLAPYPPELVAQTKQARRDKVENKTKERERERRGEVLPRTLRRQRKGLPAHLLTKLTKDQINKELIVQRSPAEVGYVGQLKQEKGWKLRTPKEGVSSGETWSVVDGTWTSAEKEEKFRKELQEIRRRRRNVREDGDS